MKNTTLKKCRALVKADDVEGLDAYLSKNSNVYFNANYFLPMALDKSDGMFEYLLNRGADPNRMVDDYPILFVAVKRERISKICLLLKYGARPDLLADDFLFETQFPLLGMLNLLDCTEGDAYFIVDSYRAYGYNINERIDRHFTIMDALITQTFSGRMRRSIIVPIWNALARNGGCTYNFSTPTKQFKRMDTIKDPKELEGMYLSRMAPFDLIYENKVAEAMEYLRSKVIYINSIDCRTMYKDNLLTAIIRLGDTNNECFVRELLDMGIDPNYITYSKETAYGLADVKTREILLSYGAHIRTDGKRWKLHI